MKMNHYLFIKEDNDSFYEVEAKNIKEAAAELMGNDIDEDTAMFRKCLPAFEDDDNGVVDLYNRFVLSSERISRVMIVDTIYDDRY